MSNNNSGPKNNKIISLFVTFAILFIVVFALGIIIGKGLGGSDTPTIERSYEIGVSEEESSEIEVVEEELVEDSNENDVVAEIEPKDLVTEKDKTPKEEISKKTEDESITAESQVEGTYHIETRSEAPKPDEKASKPKTDSKEVIEEIKEAQLEKTPPSKQDKTADKNTMPKIDPSGQYTVQLGAFQNQTQANSLMNSLKSKGYPAFVKKYEATDKKLWYRVRVGTFSTKQQATIYGDKLKKQQSQVKSVFITTNN